MALRIRRGTDAERQSITPLEGELIYTTDTKELYVGDGATLGGVLVSAALSDDTSPTLSANLSLNGHDIVGTGNININGTITATGTVNLGDGVEDNVIVGGQIGSSLIPGTTDTYNLGDNLARWNEVNAVTVSAESATVNGEIAVGSIVTDGSIIRSDSTVIYNAETGALAVGPIFANGVVEAAGFIGSVFSDDSSTIIDSVNNLVVGDVENTNTTSVNIINQSLLGAVVILKGTDSVGYKAGIEIRTDGDADDAYSLFNVIGRSNNLTGQALVLERGRGTHDNPLPLEDQDELSSLTWFGLDTNTDSQFVAGIKVSVDAAPSAGAVPGQMQIATAGPNGVGGITIDSNQVVDFDIDNTVVAGVGSGEADISSVATYLKIKVAGVEYAMPLYGINP